MDNDPTEEQEVAADPGSFEASAAEDISEPTEVQRATRAVGLGAALGLFLVVWGRRR